MQEKKLPRPVQSQHWTSGGKGWSRTTGVSQVADLQSAVPKPTETSFPYVMAPTAGIEPATYCLGGSRSILLSYVGNINKVPVASETIGTC